MGRGSVRTTSGRSVGRLSGEPLSFYGNTITPSQVGRAPHTSPRGISRRAHDAQAAHSPDSTSRASPNRNQKGASRGVRGHISHVTTEPHPRIPFRSRIRSPPSHDSHAPFSWPHAQVTPKSRTRSNYRPPTPHTRQYHGRSRDEASRLAISMNALSSATERACPSKNKSTKGSGTCTVRRPHALCIPLAPETPSLALRLFQSREHEWRCSTLHALPIYQNGA